MGNKTINDETALSLFMEFLVVLRLHAPTQRPDVPLMLDQMEQSTGPELAVALADDRVDDALRALVWKRLVHLFVDVMTEYGKQHLPPARAPAPTRARARARKQELEAVA